MADERLFAADLFARALRCGEASAARSAARHLSPQVVFRRRGRDVTGREAVVAELTTISPFSPVLARASGRRPSEQENRSGLPRISVPSALRLGSTSSDLNTTI